MPCVVTLPPTPHKESAAGGVRNGGIRAKENGHPTKKPDEAEEEIGAIAGISSQILPLARLSSGNSPSVENGERKTTKDDSTPVKDTFHRLRKSLAEPLRQYFHDLQVSLPQDNEEPDQLNTPRSVSGNGGKTGSGGGGTLRARSLFANSSKGKKTESADKQAPNPDTIDRTYANMPPITITDM